jgi:hypothetical protein
MPPFLTRSRLQQGHSAANCYAVTMQSISRLAGSARQGITKWMAGRAIPVTTAQRLFETRRSTLRRCTWFGPSPTGWRRSPLRSQVLQVELPPLQLEVPIG